MSKRRIPSVNSKSKNKFIPEAKPPIKKKISFSFEIFETTEYFNLDKACAGWPNELFAMMRNVSKMTKQELIGNSGGTYRVHHHENAKPPSPFPPNVKAENCYQIRIAKSKGGIHGVFYEDVFYVIWLDPLHNLYPDNTHGGRKKVNPPKPCCLEMDEMRQKIERLEAQLKQK